MILARILIETLTQCVRKVVGLIKFIINIIVYIGSLFKDAFSVIQTKSRQIKDDK
jgi:hypothetical protein